ncbi:Uu.00g054380.m01.CDS01 [Anthostomella pinea]|uniref:Uu.00g054380.m01.CDS01 n=1 Tax=Anthostomella pinea TaxID=933095 RepID=A0AAI8YPK7_9PEZI|nr:Uu.00g054380.m01.CDS01 [Anthostomella pinea]
MALSSPHNIFFRLPPATAALLLSAVFGLSDGHALPRQTKTVEFHELDVVPFPPLPTDAPLSPFELLRRQESTVCGYIGGNSDLPATCSAGSHCVLDNLNGVVGCCPNGGTCTAGVFTGCVDGNSAPQTEINPYVYTCQGANVCYQNQFAGGYSQYGCGTASDLGTTVQTSADGASTALALDHTTVSQTATPISLSEPTTIGSHSPTSTDSSSTTGATSSGASSTSSSPSTSSTSSTSTSTTSSPTPSSTESTSSTSSDPANLESSTTSPSATAAPAGDTAASSSNHTGAIVGGTVGGAAALVLLIALAVLCLRKRRKDNRQGPRPTPGAAPDTGYMSPMQSRGAAFAPLPSDDQRSPPMAYNQYSQIPYNDQWATGTTTNISSGYTMPSQSASLRYNPAHVAGMGTGLAPVAEEHTDDEPDAREIDEFSRAYSSAGIGRQSMDHRYDFNDDDDDGVDDDDVPEDRRPLRDSGGEIAGGPGSGGAGNRDSDMEAGTSVMSSPPQSQSSRGGGHRPLWQQNRQQSRNLMWL